MENKKMGRPTTNPKTKTLKIRLSDQESELLDLCSKKLGKTKTDTLLEGLTKIYEQLK